MPFFFATPNGVRQHKIVFCLQVDFGSHYMPAGFSSMLGFVRTCFLLDRIIIWFYWLCVLHTKSPFQTDCSWSFIIEMPQGIVSFVARKCLMCFKRLDFCFQEQLWRTLCLKGWEGVCLYFCFFHIPRFGKDAAGYGREKAKEEA